MADLKKIPVKKIPEYNKLVADELFPISIMKKTVLHATLAASLLALLTACGGGDIAPGADPITTAAVKVSQHVAAGEQPVADCEPERCAGLRIIDGNAEAWRVDSQRRLPNS